jgi:hypothetical protein
MTESEFKTYEDPIGSGKYPALAHRRILIKDLDNIILSGFSYSETEQNTGEIWLDGKPIYRKTFIKIFTETGIEFLVLDSNTIFDTLIKQEIICYVVDSNVLLGPVYFRSGNINDPAFSMNIIVNSDNTLRLWKNILIEAYKDQTYYLTAYYTKTTD